jgi:hypothetical protein
MPTAMDAIEQPRRGEVILPLPFQRKLKNRRDKNILQILKKTLDKEDMK